MKNLFLTLAFIFTATTSFAVNNAVEEDPDCVDVKLSCGVEYEICDYKGNTTQLLKSVLINDDIICD